MKITNSSHYKQLVQINIISQYLMMEENRYSSVCFSNENFILSPLSILIRSPKVCFRESSLLVSNLSWFYHLIWLHPLCLVQ